MSNGTKKMWGGRNGWKFYEIDPNTVKMYVECELKSPQSFLSNCEGEDGAVVDVVDDICYMIETGKISGDIDEIMSAYEEYAKALKKRPGEGLRWRAERAAKAAESVITEKSEDSDSFGGLLSAIKSKKYTPSQWFTSEVKLVKGVCKLFIGADEYVSPVNDIEETNEILSQYDRYF